MQKMDIAIGSAQSILESITDAFYLLDRNWKFAYLNPQASVVLGYARDELVGQSLWDVYPGLIGTALERAYRKVAAEQVSESVTFYFPDHDRWYEVHAYPAPNGIAVYFQNVTDRVLADQRLRESERHFRNMADAIPQIVWITDAVGKTEFFNQQWYLYTNTKPTGQDAGDISAEYVHPDDHAPTMAAWEEARRKGSTFLAEHRIRSAAGEYRWFLVRAEPYIDPESGQITRWYGTSTDIHDKRVAEKALKESEERYRTLTLATTQIVWRTEPTGEVLADSPSWRSFTGQTYEEWKGFGWTDALHPDDVQRILVPWKQAITERAIFECEYRLRRRDGEYRWTAVRAVPVLNEDGSIREWIGTNTDIDEKKRILADLELSQERLKLATQGTKIGIWDWDVQTDQVSWSDECHQTYGVPREDFGGRVEDFLRLVHPDDLPGVWKQFEKDLETSNFYLADFRIRRPDGEIRWISNWGNIYRDESGTAIRVVGTTIDITDRKQAELALQEQDRRKDEFLAMLAHELRNPLAPISAAADLIEMDSTLDGDLLRKTGKVIQRQVKHMTGLIDDLLDVSRVTRGIVKLDKKELDMKRIVYEAMEQIEPLIESKRHRFTMALSPESALIWGDQKRLVQILTNILNNSVKYTPEGGAIHLQMGMEDDHIQLSIADNGIGIEPELQSSVFELFSQAQRTSDRSQGGLGIGLALVKSLVELHDGTVICKSEGIGKGSTFIVTLPRLVKQEATGADQEAQPDRPSFKNRLRVLVVDDNADAAQMLSLCLQASGHEVSVALNPVEALQRAQVERPDIFVLDIGLPGMDGYELARQLKRKPDHANALFIAATGYGQDQDRHKGFEAGFDHYLVKPVSAVELLSVIERGQGASHKP